MHKKIEKLLKPFLNGEHNDVLLRTTIDDIVENNLSRDATILRKSLVEILSIDKDKDREVLFQYARESRNGFFKNKGFVRGVVEIASSCIQDCDYCPMRKSNRSLKRYVATPDLILQAAHRVKAAGIPIFFLQAGEVPVTTKLCEETIPQIKKDFINVLLNLGDKSTEEYKRLYKAGANQYIIKFETSSGSLHQQIRHYDIKQRLSHLKDLQNIGFAVGSGTIVGLPNQSLEVLANDLLLSIKLGVQMISASPFQPGAQTPLETMAPGDANITLNWMAIARILMPKLLIPSVSALNMALGEGGQSAGFKAGANVITVNFTEPELKQQYAIYDRTKRFKVKFNYALETLEKAELIPALNVNSKLYPEGFSQVKNC